MKERRVEGVGDLRMRCIIMICCYCLARLCLLF
jgi:hypothetical protein